MPINGRVIVQGQVVGVRHWERDQLSPLMLMVSPFLARRRQPGVDFFIQIPNGTSCSVRCEGELAGFIAESNLVEVRGLMRAGAISARTVVNLSTTPPSLIYQQPACFIATAACGTPDAREVGILCQFRDEWLSRWRLGRAFTTLYETVSPPLARVIVDQSCLRTLVRFLVVKPASSIARFLLRRNAS